jgi:hypothetical protein
VTGALRHAMTLSVMSAVLLLLCSSVALAQTEAPTFGDLQDTDGDAAPPEGASALHSMAADDVNRATSAGPPPKWLNPADPAARIPSCAVSTGYVPCRVGIHTSTAPGASLWAAGEVLIQFTGRHPWARNNRWKTDWEVFKYVNETAGPLDAIEKEFYVPTTDIVSVTTRASDDLEPWGFWKVSQAHADAQLHADHRDCSERYCIAHVFALPLPSSPRFLKSYIAHAWKR